MPSLLTHSTCWKQVTKSSTHSGERIIQGFKPSEARIIGGHLRRYQPPGICHNLFKTRGNSLCDPTSLKMVVYLCVFMHRRPGGVTIGSYVQASKIAEVFAFLPVLCYSWVSMETTFPRLLCSPISSRFEQWEILVGHVGGSRALLPFPRHFLGFLQPHWYSGSVSSDDLSFGGLSSRYAGRSSPSSSLGDSCPFLFPWSL